MPEGKGQQARFSKPDSSSCPWKGPLPASLMSPLEDWDGISVPPTPNILTDGQEALRGEQAELTFARSELWLRLCHAAYDLQSLIYNAHVGASGSRRGWLWRDVLAGGKTVLLTALSGYLDLACHEW